MEGIGFSSLVSKILFCYDNSWSLHTTKIISEKYIKGWCYSDKAMFRKSDQYSLLHV